jgi:hypothetical protein
VGVSPGNNGKGYIELAGGGGPMIGKAASIFSS